MGVGTSRRNLMASESSVNPTENGMGDLHIEILSDEEGTASGTTTPPVIIELVASGKEEQEDLITKLNKKLTEEHRQIIQKIEADLQLEGRKFPRKLHTSKDSQTDSEVEDLESVASAPVTQTEFDHINEKQNVLSRAQDVQKSLADQCDEIAALRAQMLGEYEQLLSVRTEVMSSQSEEVEKLQQEMAKIQQQYEDQMATFQEKVQSQTEASLRAELADSHAKELEEMKQYYATKVSEMEQSYTTDITQLKQEHAELLVRLQGESAGSPTPMPGTLPQSVSQLEKQREYVRKTTTLTAISDEDETPPSSPPGANEMLEGRIKALEETLRDREKLVDELKKRLEAEITSAEDLHGKLLDSNKALCDYEDSFKAKGEEIEELRKALTIKDTRISDLESEKAALEEKGEKDQSLSIGSESDLVEELKRKIEHLEHDLSASKEANHKLQQELNQLDSQHGEAIMKLKEEMENLNQTRINELETGFQIQLEEELKQQADELENKFKEEADKQSEEIEIYKQTESELKTQLENIQYVHEKQLNELKEKYESESKLKESVEPQIEVSEVMEVQTASPVHSAVIDRDSLEAAIREKVRVEVLEEYEQSIDTLKNEYQERIDDLNTRIQSFESQEVEKSQIADKEKDASEEELTRRESFKAELAQEFKEKLQNVTNEYENKLKQLQDIVDGKQEAHIAASSPTLSKSQSLDLGISISTKEKAVPRSPQEYEGFVTTIRREYEDKINTLQTEIAQYQSSMESVPSTPLSPKSKEFLEQTQVDGVSVPVVRQSPDAGSEIPPKLLLGSTEMRQEIYDEIAKEFETSFKNLSSDYEKQMTELTTKLSALEADSINESEIENKIREEVGKEFEEKIANLKNDYEEKVKQLTDDLEKAISNKNIAEKKVKADMFVWHEETVTQLKTQLKRKHDETISQLRKEFDEKMELYREELQEGFDAEKERISQDHKQDIADLQDRYDNLVEDLRSGEVPGVAEMVQEKFDMELEMAKTLIQQECDETIESEQSRISEDYEQHIKQILAQRDNDLDQQKVRHEKELADLRNTLLQQYQSQIFEMESVHEAAMLTAQLEFQALVEKVKHETSQDGRKSPKSEQDEKGDETEKSTSQKSEKSTKSQKSLDSKTSTESEIEEEINIVTSTTDSGTDKSDQDDDEDGDRNNGSKAIPSETSGDHGDQESRETREEEIKKETGTKDGGNTKDKGDTVEDVGLKSESSDEESELFSIVIQQLRQELAVKVSEYETIITQLKATSEEEITQLKATNEEEITQLMANLADKETEYQQRLQEMAEQHDQEVKEYQDAMQKLRQDMPDSDSTEALELAHQQELHDLEDRLVLKYQNEMDNLEIQHQSRVDDMMEKHRLEVEQLHRDLTEAQRAMDQYPDTLSPVHTVPTFRAASSLGSTKGSEDDFMVPTQKVPFGYQDQVAEIMTQLQATQSESLQGTGTMETQVFEVRTSSEDSPKGSLQGTLEEVGVVSLDTTMDQSRGTLRGVDDTQDTELIEFSEEDSDKSTEEDTATDTQKSDRSTPTVLMQTHGYGAGIGGGPTVKSLDDTTDSSFRVSEKEEMTARIKELEGEVEDLHKKLEFELSKQDDQMDRLDREKQEESNLTGMLRADIERLNSDREAFQNTNEHLLGLLSDAVKTYMSVDDSISKKLKGMMDKSIADRTADKSADKSGGDKGRPGSAERKKTPPPTKRSPVASPGRLSPARADDPDNPQETSILSNVTDEGLDLSQRISDSIFQGPDLASEEEELLIDSGSRLRSSVSRLLDMIDETTSQLLETKQTQSEVMDTLEVRGHDLEQMSSRCSDLEERLREEVERKDFLALELHKAEGLIEGYTAERDMQEQQILDLEEQKEALVLELETIKNKLLDMQATHEENEKLKKEMTEQQQLITQNVGEEAQALILEVTRLNSESREKDLQIKQVHDRFESHVRELETSGEDMEQHYNKLLDDKKREVTDLKLQVEAYEKQLKAKKQFIEEQSSEREQEHEDYQKELEHWKKMVHDLEKQNGAGSRLQREIDDLTEQLQARVDLHNEALLECETRQREVRDRDLSMKELQSIIQQLEQELQDRVQEIKQNKQKLNQVEEELSRRPFSDEELTDSVKSDMGDAKTLSSAEFDDTAAQKQARLVAQMTVEEELRQAAKKTKEELVREKHALQTQVNECLVQISGLRNQLDEMRHRKDFSEVSEVAKRLKMEREKSEEKDKEICELKLEVEQLGDRVDNRDQQIDQLRERGTRTSPLEGVVYDGDRELETQVVALKRENKQLRERVQLSVASSVTDMSGLSQNLLEEKNQEIDHLSGQVLRLQTEFTELKSENGVEDLYEELEALKLELKQKEKEVAELASVRVSQSFTDHSLTPDSSMLNVGASFSEKASIQQELEESESHRLERVVSLESELSALKAVLQAKEEQIFSLESRIYATETKNPPTGKTMPDDVGMLQVTIGEKEELITQLSVQIDSLQAEVDNLSDFQNKLQEDFDTVQTMLEDKDREIESLTKELNDRSPEGTTEEHSLVIKHEVEISRLKKELREKDNVVEEKMEEIAELSDKVEIIESDIMKYKHQERDYGEQIVEKEGEIQTLKKQVEKALKVAQPPVSMSEDEKDEIIREKTEEIEQLMKALEEASLGRPPSPPLSQDEKSELIQQQKEEIESLKKNVQKLLGRPPSPPISDDEKTTTIKRQKSIIDSLRGEVEAVSLGRPPSPPESDEERTDVIHRLRVEIEKLKQQIMDSNLSEDDKSILIRELRLENEMLKKQIDAALKIRPPSPPRDEEEKSELIRNQEKEIERLRNQVEAALKIRPPSPPRSEEEKSIQIRKQEKDIAKLKKQVDAALQIAPPPPPMSEDEKDRVIQQKEIEVATLKSELTNVTESFEKGEQGRLIKEKVEEVLQLRNELDEVKHLLESREGSGRVSSPISVLETLKEKEDLIEQKDRELSVTKEKVKHLEEELESAKEVKAYEDEIELKEKEDEIEQLQEELESYRSGTKSSSLSQSIELELSLGGDSRTPDSKQLVRSMSFYKDQYEDKCSQNQQLQVMLDLAKQQLEIARNETDEDAAEQNELFKANLEREKRQEIEELKKEKDELKKEKLRQDKDEMVTALEEELIKAKEEATKERLDNVQTINDMEAMRERKEKERRDSLKTIQELESDLEDKVVQERQLNNQIRQLTEELTVIKRQYGIADKASPELKFDYQETFELGTNVETLQQQVMQFKQHADKAKDILAEKQKYQSQVVKLEILYENLQKKMKKDVSQLEEELKAVSSKPDHGDVWEQLHATQERLEKTTEQLAETGQRLSETDSNLQRVTAELTSRDSAMKELQQDLWNTSSKLSVTSGKLQETEEKLRLTLAQVTEREDQIHQLQGELQHTQHEAEQAMKEAKTANAAAAEKPEEVEMLRQLLKQSEAELDAVKKSLTEAVEMSEQQLQIAENKDQEFVKLKLDIQQTIAEKDKLIRDQKQKIKEKGQEVAKVKQEVQKTVATKEQQIAKLKEDTVQLQHQVELASGAGNETTTTVATLKAQLQNQEEVILTLESDLKEAKVKVQEKDKEIDNIHTQHDQSRTDETDTIDAMHNQISELQRELEELRSATKGHGARSQDDRDQSPYDQNGRLHGHEGHQQPRTDGEGRRMSSEQYRGQGEDGETYDPQGRSRSLEQDDSGHQSYDQQASGRSPQYGPEGQSASPQQRRGQSTQQNDKLQYHGQGQQYRSSPKQQQVVGQEHRSVYDDDFDHQPQGQGERVWVRGQGDQQFDEHFTQQRAPRSQTAPRRQQLTDIQGEGIASGQSGQFYDRRAHDQQFRGEGQEMDQRRTSPTSGSPQKHTDDQHDQQSGQGQMFSGRRTEQEVRDETGYDNGERYIGEDGQLYDRDGNIRRKYHHSSESLLRNQRSQKGQGDQNTSEDIDGQIPEGASGEAERYIQQLRRELLITKTALMQIQRGGSLERAVSPEEEIAEEIVQDVMSRAHRATRQQTIPQERQASQMYPRHHRDQAEVRYDTIPDEEEVHRLQRDLDRAEEELQLYRTSSNLSARDFVQKVMNLKDELSSEHQRHIQEMASRGHQDTETQLAAMRIKYTDEIEHIKRLHAKELEEKLRDLKQKMERKHKGEMNKLVLRHQEEVSVLKSRGGEVLDDVILDRQHRGQRQGGVGQDQNGTATLNGHANDSMSDKLQNILRRLHSEGVQVLTISELEFLNRSQSLADLPRDADPESMKAGWENERQSFLSTIQSLKDLLAQTHKLRGLEKDDDDNDDDYYASMDGSDWRAELLRAIGYVFTKERESLLAELRSHVLSHPSSNVDEIQRLEQKIRTQEAHHHASLDQIFSADRQSMLSEIRDLRAHSTIARMHNQEERERQNEKHAHTEDQALKKERQLKRQVQLLEFKIQQERVLQEDLRTSLDAERNRTGDLSGQISHEKSSNLDLQSMVSGLQVQVGKLKESLEREQSRYVSVTNALEEEKSKSINLSELLESERETLWRLQSEVESLKQQQTFLDPRAIEQLQVELESEQEHRRQANNRQEIDCVTIDNLRQEVEMEKRHQNAIETEMSAKISQLQKIVEMEKRKNGELDKALEKEHTLSARLQRTLEAEKSNLEQVTGQERALIEDLQIQLETERSNVHDLNNALQREQGARDDVSSSAETEKNLLKDHLNQERALNEDLKHEMDQLQFERLEATNKFQKEHDFVQRLKAERDQINEDLRKLRSLEMQRDHDREAERLADKKAVRQADRDKEDYRMKLHEQELEVQRITQKALGLEDELAETRENELKAIRELEQERIRNMQVVDQQSEMISVQTSPRPDLSDGGSVESVEERRMGWQVYRSQLESMCQSLHYLILRCREQLNKASHSGQQRQWDLTDFDTLQKSLRDLLSEVKQLQEIEGDFMSHPSGSVNERILRQNEELTNFVARISEEKTELRNTLTRLEEEIWRYRKMDSKYQEMQRTSEVSDHVLIAERAEWAKEKLALQMGLNSAEREIGSLQTDLRVERERRVAAGITDARDTDKVKIQRLYGKYLRAESFRKALIYQKKYLLLLLGGFQDTEETTLALLARMGAIDHSRHSSRHHRVKPLTTFRGAVRVVIAISRMKYLVKKWRRATRVGSEVVGGTVDQTNGYMPQASSYSPPRYTASPRITSAPMRSVSSPPRASSLSSSYHRRMSPQRSSDPAPFSSPQSHLDYDSYSSSSYVSSRPTATHVPSTPPTKDYSSTTRYTSPSSGARRKILTSASIPSPSVGHVRFMSTDDSKNGDLGDTDDYIHRLENLQTRLGTLQNGRTLFNVSL